jgi:hypothetical protein
MGGGGGDRFGLSFSLVITVGPNSLPVALVSKVVARLLLDHQEGDDGLGLTTFGSTWESGPVPKVGFRVGDSKTSSSLTWFS